MDKKGPNPPPRFISTRKYIGKLTFLFRVRTWAKKAQIHSPDLFLRASILENWSFCLAYHNGQKRPKTAALSYFHTDGYEREFPLPFLLISLLRSRGSLRLPRSLRAWIRRCQKQKKKKQFVLLSKKLWNFYVKLTIKVICKTFALPTRHQCEKTRNSLSSPEKYFVRSTL